MRAVPAVHKWGHKRRRRRRRRRRRLTHAIRVEQRLDASVRQQQVGGPTPCAPLHTGPSLVQVPAGRRERRGGAGGIPECARQVARAMRVLRTTHVREPVSRRHAGTHLRNGSWRSACQRAARPAMLLLLPLDARSVAAAAAAIRRRRWRVHRARPQPCLCPPVRPPASHWARKDAFACVQALSNEPPASCPPIFPSLAWPVTLRAAEITLRDGLCAAGMPGAGPLWAVQTLARGRWGGEGSQQPPIGGLSRASRSSSEWREDGTRISL